MKGSPQIKVLSPNLRQGGEPASVAETQLEGVHGNPGSGQSQRSPYEGSSKVFCSQVEAQAVAGACPTSFEQSGTQVGGRVHVSQPPAWSMFLQCLLRLRGMYTPRVHRAHPDRGPVPVTEVISTTGLPLKQNRPSAFCGATGGPGVPRQRGKPEAPP